MVETVKLHIFIQKLAECDELLCDKLFFAGRLDGRAQCTDRLRIFNLSNTRVRFLIGAKAFRDIFGIAGAAVMISQRFPFRRGFIVIRYSFIVYSKPHKPPSEL